MTGRNYCDWVYLNHGSGFDSSPSLPDILQITRTDRSGPHLCYENLLEGISAIPKRSQSFRLEKDNARQRERERVAVRSAWSPERFVEPANFPTLSFQSCNPTQKIVRRLGGSWQGWTTKSILSFSLGILQFYLKTSKH